MASDGDADISILGAVLADAGRCRMLFALDDGRALPASQLAAEAGVSAPTASSHLRRLVDAGLVRVEPHGRHRYHRLAGPEVGRLLETMAALAPSRPVRSLREHSRARALRDARTCYDHVAGRLGVALMRSFLDRAWLAGGDGRFHPDHLGADRLAAPGREYDYRLTPAGREFVAGFGITLPRGRAPVRYCIDWSEQAHHLAGGLGRGLLDRLLGLGWLERSPASRALLVTEAGREGLRATFAVEAA